MLRCQDADVLLSHLAPGSVRVAIRNKVVVGDRIDSVGNAGEPLLHIHNEQSRTVSVPRLDNPLPVHYARRFIMRNDRVPRP